MQQLPDFAILAQNLGGYAMPLKQKGFTLVELAVVVFLIGILASLGISALNAQMASASISSTKKKQDTIKDALIAYLGRNKRLPCPAITNAGAEARDGATPSRCVGNFGILPYAELGLPKSAAIDGYENFFSYAVSPRWTLTYSTLAPVANGTFTNVAIDAFNTGIPGVITVNDKVAGVIVIPPISATAAALVISHGKNGLGAFTSKGTQNVSAPAIGTDEFPNIPVAAWTLPVAPMFFQREYHDVADATYFDDIVLVLNPADLTTPLTKDGSFKSADSQWADQLANIKNSVIGFMFSNGNCRPPTQAEFTASILPPLGIPSTVNGVFYDPWGYQVTYSNFYAIAVVHTTGATTPPGAVTPYTLTTLNPNVPTINVPVAGTIPTTPTMGQLMGAYPTLFGNCPP